MPILKCLAFLALVAAVASTPYGSAKKIFLTDQLGQLDTLDSDCAHHFLRVRLAGRLGLQGNEVFEFSKVQQFRHVARTYRFEQRYNGLPVNGGEIALHINPNTLIVEGVSGSMVTSGPSPQEARHIEFETILKLGRGLQHKIDKIERLSLEYVSLEGKSHLCWKVPILSWKRESLVKHIISSTPEPATLYIDALTHEVVMDIPTFQKLTPSPNRVVYDAHHAEILPGFEVRDEGGPAVKDSAVNVAYDKSGDCWNYYYSSFERNSFDDAGSQLISTVHYGEGYNNAFWNGKQMVYGDGDGVVFQNFYSDSTVVCHELTHAVTTSTSNLRYFAQSGALNEAFSDMMGVSSVILKTHVPESDAFHPSVDWAVGAKTLVGPIFSRPPPHCLATPNSSLLLGIRFMDNPTCDGISKDDYNTRYTGFLDNRGVHWNSGIANLAYQLTVDGGGHPRSGVSNVTVTGLGLNQAHQVYYLAFTHYLIPGSNFADAKKATAYAANVLYGLKDRRKWPCPQARSVSDAWSAVNVMDDAE